MKFFDLLTSFLPSYLSLAMLINQGLFSMRVFFSLHCLSLVSFVSFLIACVNCSLVYGIDKNSKFVEIQIACREETLISFKWPKSRMFVISKLCLNQSLVYNFIIQLSMNSVSLLSTTFGTKVKNIFAQIHLFTLGIEIRPISNLC